MANRADDDPSGLLAPGDLSLGGGGRKGKRTVKPPTPRTLVDGQRRPVRYLRLSLTDRCNFRCEYCMPEDGLEFAERETLLDVDEMEALVRAFVGLGINRLRLTGGEPLVRREVLEIVERLSGMPGVEDVAMTTNGALLPKLAEPLRRAGLDRVNVSLDSLDPERFRAISRTGRLDRVLEGLGAAREAGLEPIKLNAVVIRGHNDDELADLVRYAAAHDHVLRFIEFMPIGVDGFWSDETFVPADEMIERLRADFEVGEPIGYGPDAAVAGAGPAVYRDLRPREGGPSVRVGFISAVSHGFCETCNRVRLTADGTLQECLATPGTLSLRDELRAGASEDRIAELVERSLWHKSPGHGFNPEDGGRRVSRTMSMTGG